MKKLIYSDSDGYQYRSLVRNGDSDPSVGILQSPPDLRQLDWQEIARSIHNDLLEQDLLTLKDVQVRSNEFNKIVLANVMKRIYRLYQQEEF